MVVTSVSIFWASVPHMVNSSVLLIVCPASDPPQADVNILVGSLQEARLGLIDSSFKPFRETVLAMNRLLFL